MKLCDLCGAEVSKKLDKCTRCGFEFQKEIKSDVRDRAILKKHYGKTVDIVKRDLKNRQAQLSAYLDNISAKSLSNEELVTLLDDALSFLQIPSVMGVEDELKFDDDETKFIRLVTSSLENADSENNMPVGSTSTYIRLSNTLHSMGDANKAMAMIEKALLINPRDLDATYAKAKLLFYAKKYDLAKKCLERLISKGNDDKAKYLFELIEQLNIN